MAVGGKPKDLGEIFHKNTKFTNENSLHIKSQYIQDELDEPKHTIGNPQMFAKSREVLGNIISKRMKTSGGTDVDWLIEHNGGFIILELKIFSDDKILISKAQMLAYEKLYDGLKKRHILFLGHYDINFKNLADPVWMFEMNEWKSCWIPHTEGNLIDPTYSDKEIHGYIIEKDHMNEIDVKLLRDKIDSIWNEFER